MNWLRIEMFNSKTQEYKFSVASSFYIGCDFLSAVHPNAVTY